MQDQELMQDEFETDFENDEFEFETELESESTLDETEEMELAAELLGISSEEELDQFLGKLFKSIGRGLGKFGKFVGRNVLRPLGGVLKGIAKKALPFLGGALGSLVPIPGVGTALGSALGGAASKLLEFESEGLDSEEQEFEVARRFVRLASTAAAQAAQADPGADPRAAVLAAIRHAASQLPASPRSAERGRAANGRWIRRGRKIVLLGV